MNEVRADSSTGPLDRQARGLSRVAGPVGGMVDARPGVQAGRASAVDEAAGAAPARATARPLSRHHRVTFRSFTNRSTGLPDLQ
ncbi:hypothetical protein GCM10025331_34330 [Actinoplanes utahensis]|nr:hypothetical protein Aut01nite_47090 [Actinoplanes utahensis]